MDTIDQLRVVPGSQHMSEVHPYVFGTFRLDAEKRLLFRDDKRIAIRPKIFDLLFYLVSHEERVVTRDELLAEIWPDLHVQESSLTVGISTLRQILGEPADEHQYIATIPGRGYKFVSRVSGESTAAAASRVASWPVASQSLQGVTPVSLALLPFSAIGRIRNRAAMQVGIVDTLVVHLTKIRVLQVIPTTSVHSLLELVRSMKNQHRLEGIDFLLEGHIQGTKRGIRVGAQVLVPETGEVRWATTFDIAGNDQSKLEGMIARKLATQMERAIRNNDFSPPDSPLFASGNPMPTPVGPASGPQAPRFSANRSRLSRVGSRRRRRWSRPAALVATIITPPARAFWG